MLEGHILVRPVRKKSPIDIPDGVELPFHEGIVVRGGTDVKEGDRISFGKHTRGGSPIDGTRFGIKVEVEDETLFALPESKVLGILL